MCFSRVLVDARGITAGSVFATIEMRLVMIEALDCVTSCCRCVRLTCYVDDVGVEMTSTATEIERRLPQVTLAFTRPLERVGLEFSATKNAVTASCGTLAGRLEAKLERLRVRRRDRVKSLGTGLGAGRRRNAQVGKRRLEAFKQRRVRFRILKRAGGSVPLVLRTGGIASLTYGQEVAGVASTALLSQRRSVASALVTEGAGD